MKIVLTGGPSAGKTVVAEYISREFKDQVVIVPEAASILFSGGFPRGTSASHIMHQQRAIYFTQVELENMIEEENSGKLIVCDRGTLDGMAYWPEGPTNFFKGLDTTLQRELERYNFVIHLESATTSHFDRSNPVRIEGPHAAHALDYKIKTIWADHPQRFIIKNSTRFSEKVSEVLLIIRNILDRSIS